MSFLLMLWMSILHANQLEKTNAPLGRIEVHVGGFRNALGDVVVALFDKEEDFPKMDKALRMLKKPANTETVQLDFDGLPYGTYAIALIHDENSNETIDFGPFFIPSEGYGASNDARGTFGPPKFKDAKFDLNTESLQLKLKLKYGI